MSTAGSPTQVADSDYSDWSSDESDVADSDYSGWWSDESWAESDAYFEECRNILVAAERGNVEEVRHFLREDPDSVKKRGMRGREPLHVAAERDHVDVVEVLLHAGASVDATDTFGYTALHLAALSGRDAVVEWLLAAGASVDAVNKYGQTPYQMAERQGHAMVLGWMKPVCVVTLSGEQCRCNSHTIRTINDLKDEVERKLGIKSTSFIGPKFELLPVIEPGITLTAYRQPSDQPVRSR